MFRRSLKNYAKLQLKNNLILIWHWICYGEICPRNLVMWDNTCFLGLGTVIVEWLQHRMKIAHGRCMRRSQGSSSEVLQVWIFTQGVKGDLYSRRTKTKTAASLTTAYRKFCSHTHHLPLNKFTIDIITIEISNKGMEVTFSIKNNSHSSAESVKVETLICYSELVLSDQTKYY